MWNKLIIKEPELRIKNRIKIEDCKEGYVYYISARNGRVGVYSNKEFTLSRHKFGANFLFDETHYDADDHFGTACPIMELEKFPGGDMKEYLNEQELKVRDWCPYCGKPETSHPMDCPCQHVPAVPTEASAL